MAYRPKVVIVDDEPEIGGLLKLFLEDEFDVTTFTDPRLACEEVSKNRYDLVVSDIKMPFLSGLDVVRYVKKTSPSTEVVLITGHAQTENDKAEARELGAAGILFKPFGDPIKVLAYLNDVISSGKLSQAGRSDDAIVAKPEVKTQAQPSRSPMKPLIMVIDDEADLVDVVLMLLSDDYEVVAFTNPKEALGVVGARDFKCIVTDLNMPQMRGKDFILKLRAISPKVPIVIMSGHSLDDDEVKDALAAGASDLLSKPFPDPATILTMIGKYTS